MKFLNKILPSFKLRQDIPIQYNKLDDLEPIPLGELSLISPIKKKILHLREKSCNIKIECLSSKKMSLIVPYRYRKAHLEQFIPYMKKYLEKQDINYEIIVVEQEDNKPFNRAKLMNIGALHAAQDVDYFVFHDVDLLPENINYRYTNHTQKCFTYIKENDNYKKYAPQIFGGATLVPKNIFLNINGFSNNYWQWGKEDDDFLLRHLFKGLIPLYNTKGKFISLPHASSLTIDKEGKESNDKNIIKENKLLYKKNKKRFSNFKRGLAQQENEGLNSIDNYTINKIEKKDGVTFIYVQFN